MAIRVTIAGVTYEADTSAEIVELQQLLSGQQGRLGLPLATPKPVVPLVERSELTNGAPDYRTFVSTLNANGRAVMAEIIRNAPQGVGTERLAEAAKVQMMSLPPIFKHIRSAAAKAHIDPDSILTRKQVVGKGTVRSEYQLNERIADVMRELVK